MYHTIFLGFGLVLILLHNFFLPPCSVHYFSNTCLCSIVVFMETDSALAIGVDSAQLLVILHLSFT